MFISLVVSNHKEFRCCKLLDQLVDYDLQYVLAGLM